jgi:hypothetical protein
VDTELVLQYSRRLFLREGSGLLSTMDIGAEVSWL